MSSSTTNIESVLHEERVFPPAASFSEAAHIKSPADYERLREEAAAAPDEFWARMAEAELHWFKRWDTVLKWDAPHAQWFWAKTTLLHVSTASTRGDSQASDHLEATRRTAPLPTCNCTAKSAASPTS